MNDFYENLAAMENEAMRRARRIGNAEREAARAFHQAPEPPPAQPKPPPHNPIEKLLGNSLFGGNAPGSPDMSLVLMLLLILHSDNRDPLLMLALMYILM